MQQLRKKSLFCILPNQKVYDFNWQVISCNQDLDNMDKNYYRQVSGIRLTLFGNKIVDNSDVVGASPVGAAPTTSSLST